MKKFYLAALFLLAGCAQPSTEPAKPQVDLAKEEAAIRATDDQWKAAIKARDAQKTASFWTDDATLLFPNQAPVTGKAAIIDFVTNAYKDPDFSVTWTTNKIEVAAGGDIASQIASETFTFRVGKKLVTQHNNGVVVWKKQSDGAWKADVDIGTPAPEAAPAKK
jgi:uncharacterized protein (TIGR02246 family)